jgi:hypothetical protein
MDQMKVGCTFCHSTGKVSQVSTSGTRTEICFMCHGRGFTVMTIHNPNPISTKSCGAETTV